jgi:hypothetical protein
MRSRSRTFPGEIVAAEGVGQQLTERPRAGRMVD